MSIFKPFMGAIILLLSISSCHRGEKKSTSPNEITTENYKIKESSEEKKLSTEEKKIEVFNDQQLADSTFPPPPQTPVKSGPSTPVQVKALPDYSKKIIKNATVKLEVKDFNAYNDLLNTKVKQYGAYIAQEDNNISDERTETVVSIKVPVQFFDELMNALSDKDAKMMEKSIKSEDVTGDIVDTRSRLEAKKQMRLKYLDFLKESKNMTEVLQVQDEINNIQEEIEAASGRYASLTTQAAYSTINLTYYKPVEGFSLPDTKPGLFSKLGNAFGTGAAWLSELLIGLISIWPLLLLISIAFFLYKKRKVNVRMEKV